jgi:hypothetical protein
MFLHRVCLDIIIKLVCMLCTTSHESEPMTVSINQHRVEQGEAEESPGDILFIESNHKIIQISCSEKLINSSAMTLERRDHLPCAVWSSSLSEVSFMREKR